MYTADQSHEVMTYGLCDHPVERLNNKNFADMFNETA